MALSFIAPTSITMANSFGPVFADNASQTFFYDDDLGSTRTSAMEYARINALDAPTVMTTSRKTSYTALVDVWSYGEWTPSGDERSWYAWTQCVRLLSISQCEQHVIVFNMVLPHSDYKSLACHEIGHFVGLGHASGLNSDETVSEKSCMRGRPDHRDYAVHDHKHLTSRYG